MEKYRVNKVIGEGSFGKAILCARISDGKACVVKQIDTSALPPKARKEAAKEATLLAMLSHPNIVGFWESFLHGHARNMLCIVMDYADGGDLSSCLRARRGRLLEEEVILDWFVQTTLALKHIHDRKILHRDLKTQNIFLTRSRIVKLGDFGIAKVLGNTMDLARTAIGTPLFMSPEICQDKRYNHKSDMWSLGCVLYEMACLRHAFEGNNMRLLVVKITTFEPRPVPSRYSAGLRSLLTQLLRKDPKARPSTGSVLRRPLVKEKIGRFLSEAQIAEEFSHTVLHRRRSGNSSPVSALSAVASPEARVRQPLLPENPPRRPSPSSVLERKDSPPNPSILQNGIAAAVGGKAFAVKGHELGAPLGAEGNEALREANHRKKEINAGGDGIRAQGARHPVKRGGSDAEKKLVAARQAQYRQQRRDLAKKRANVAAAALGVAQQPSPRRRTPKRAGEVGEAAAKKYQGVEDAARRARERARVAVAREALGVGRKSPPRAVPSPETRRAEQLVRASPDAGGRVTPKRPPPLRSPIGMGKENPATGHPHRPSRGVSPPEGRVDLEGVKGKAGERKTSAAAAAAAARLANSPGGEAHRRHADGRDGPAFQQNQNLRFGVAAPAEGAVGTAVSADRAEQESESREVVDTKAAVDVTRRQRAARAVFGLNFGDVLEGGGKMISARPEEKGVEEEKDSDVKESAATPAPALSNGCDGPVTAAMPPLQESVGPIETVAAADTYAEPEHGTSDAAVGATDVEGRESKDETPGAIDDTEPKAVEKTQTSSLARDEERRMSGGDYEPQGSDGDIEIGGSIGASEQNNRLDGPPLDCVPPVVPKGGGDSNNPRVDLGLGQGWLQNLEAKMGAIKAQVDQIKSPPEFTPRRKGKRRDRAGRRNPPRPTTVGNVRDRGENDEESNGSPCVASPILEEDSPLDGHELPISEEGEPVEEKGKGYGSDLRGAAGDESVGKAEMNWREYEVVRMGKLEELDGAKSLEDQGTPSAFFTPIKGASADDREPVQAKSHPRSKLLSAAAAIDEAAAVFAAIPKTPPRVRPTGRNDDLVDDGESLSVAPPPEIPPSSGERSAESKVSRRAVSRAGLGGAAVITTPAQRGRGRRTRAVWTPKASVVVSSEKKPTRHAAALATELERHSEGPKPRKKQVEEGKLSGGSPEGCGKGHTPTTEERVQALRAARDRERAELRALIARQRRARKAPLGADGAATGRTTKTGGGIQRKDGDTHEEQDGEQTAQSQDRHAPSGWMVDVSSSARKGSVAFSRRIPASEPPPRARCRVPSGNLTRVNISRLGKQGTSSARAGRRRRGQAKESNGRNAGKAEEGHEPESHVVKPKPKPREPAKRQRELRAFIAKQRRQAKQIESDNQNRGSDASDVKSDDDPGEDDDDDDDDNSVLTTAAPASPRSAPPALRFSADSRPASSAVPTALPDAVLLGARTLCFEVDEESKPSGGSVLTGGSTIERIENDVVPAVIETEDCSAGSNEHSPTKELKQGDGGDEAASTPHFERRWRVDHAVSSSEQRSPSKDRVVVEPFVAKEVQEAVYSKPEARKQDSCVAEGGQGQLLEQGAEGNCRSPSQKEHDVSTASVHPHNDVVIETSVAGSHPTTTGPAGGTTSVVQEEASTSDDAYASPDSHAFWCGAGGPGALEGVHPGLATYESQRAALMPGRGFVAGAEDGAARAREYSLMLGQMQEVLELGADDASTDSSWGDSSKSDEPDRGASANGSNSASTNSGGSAEEEAKVVAKIWHRPKSTVRRDRAHPPGLSPHESRESAIAQGASGLGSNHSPTSGREAVPAGDSGPAQKEVRKLPRYGAKLASKLSARSLLASVNGNISITSSKETEIGSGPVGAKRRSLSPPWNNKVEGKRGCENSSRSPSPGTLSSRLENRRGRDQLDGDTSPCRAGIIEGGGSGVPSSAGGRPGTVDRGGRVGNNGMREDREIGSVDGPVLSVPQATAHVFRPANSAECASSGELRGLSIAGDQSLDAESGSQREGGGTRHHERTDAVPPPPGANEQSGVTGGDARSPSLQGQHERSERRIPSPSPDERHKTVGAEVARCHSKEAGSSGEEKDRVLSGVERLTLSREESAFLRNRLSGELGNDTFHNACRYLREVDLDGGDDETMTMKVERILGGAEHLNHLPDLLRLVAAEQMRSSSGGGGGSDGGGGDDHM